MKNRRILAMKKLAALLLCLVLTGGALSCAALAEQTWQCPACGREGLAEYQEKNICRACRQKIAKVK